MNRYEHYQNEDSIDDAYSNELLETSLQDNAEYCEEDIDLDDTTYLEDEEVMPNLQKSTINNLWDFLGLSNLNNKEKGCLFDCGYKGTMCLSNCDGGKNNKVNKKCNYKCMGESMSCSKKCIEEKPIPTTHVVNSANPTTHATNPTNPTNPTNQTNLTTTSVNARYLKASNMPTGVKTYYDDYAPVDSNLWPSYTQTGWDMNKIATAQKEEYIEVLIPNKFPI
jgi:hypothetical protein